MSEENKREKENEKSKGIEKNEKTKRGIEKNFLKFPTTFSFLFRPFKKND
ncbi:hypothetical protein [Methanosarcina siciliae]|nr:hypothetical protein [Methanosarcina siciliae]